MDEFELLQAGAALGEDCENFFNSELGQYILGRIVDKQEEINTKLQTTPIFRKMDLIRFQAEYKAFQSLQSFIADCIHLGRQSAEILAKMHNE